VTRQSKGELRQLLEFRTQQNEELAEEIERLRAQRAELPELPLDTRRWLAEEVVTELGIPGISMGQQQARFFVMQCQHCMGVHFRACPRVRRLELYENGALKQAWYYDDWDDSDVIYPEQVFGTVQEADANK
jgi:hypothetical protein